MIHFPKLRWDRIIMKCAWRCSSSHSITSTFRRGDHVSGKPRDVNLFKVDDECLEAVGCYLSLIVFVAELDEDEDQRQVTTANSFRNQTSVSGVQVPALCWPIINWQRAPVRQPTSGSLLFLRLRTGMRFQNQKNRIASKCLSWDGERGRLSHASAHIIGW